MASVRENITANVATACAAISTAGGYDNDIPGGVQRFLQTGLNVSTVPTIVVQFDSESKSLGPSDQYTCDLTIGIDIWAVHDTSTVTGSTWTLIDSLVTDVEKALNLDNSRGGYAHDSEISTVSPFRLSEGMPFVGATIQMSVTYAHQAGDPEVIR
jgi:hypothetical protein